MTTRERWVLQPGPLLLSRALKSVTPSIHVVGNRHSTSFTSGFAVWACWTA